MTSRKRAANFSSRGRAIARLGLPFAATYWVLFAQCTPILPDNSGPPDAPTVMSKWDLWTNVTQLRGANVQQSRVILELDGPDFKGPGPYGPPYTQSDIDRLATLGANYVNISHPGLFTEVPPYELDEDAVANLDSLLDMIERADMFAVISLRTGPGRSQFTFLLGQDNVSDPVNGFFDPMYYNDAVWTDQAAQDAWAAMWRYTADRYKNNAVVVGYDLMVEPNAESVFFDLFADPQSFYPQYADTTYDWNRFYPNLVTAIRQVDAETPILVQPMGFGSILWLPFLAPSNDDKVVYAVHQYAPGEYTHQDPPLSLTYPDSFDLDGDTRPDQFNRDWLNNLLSTVDDYVTANGGTAAVNEFGLKRWEPNAAAFMRDEINLFEDRGLNHALWVWDPSWPAYTEATNDFNIRHGPTVANHTDVVSSELMNVIRDQWQRNIMRPSVSTFRSSNGS